MWYLINQDGERCEVVKSENDAIKECNNDSWYIGYVYSNNERIM